MIITRPSISNFINNIPLTICGTVFMVVYGFGVVYSRCVAICLSLIVVCLSLFVNNLYGELKETIFKKRSIAVVLLTFAVIYSFFNVGYVDKIADILSKIIPLSHSILTTINVVAIACVMLLFASAVINFLLKEEDEEDIKFFTSIVRSKKFDVLIKVFGTAVCLLLIANIFNINAFDDELFCIELGKMPLKDMFYYTSQDVHPPLYYVMLHFWLKIFAFQKSDFFTIIITRLFSLIGFTLTSVLCYKKLENKLPSNRFWLLMIFVGSAGAVLMSCNLARMYAWGIFFVTAVMFFSKDIMNNSTPPPHSYL